jgi:hypothetical protein
MTSIYILAEKLAADTNDKFKAAMLTPGVEGATVRLTYGDIVKADGSFDFSQIAQYRALMPDTARLHLAIPPVAGPAAPPYKTVTLNTVGPFGDVGDVAYPCIWDPAFADLTEKIMTGLAAYLDENGWLDLLDGFRIANSVTYPGDGEWGFRSSSAGKRYDTEWQAAGYTPQAVLSAMSAHGSFMAKTFPGSFFTFAPYSPEHSAVRVNDAGQVFEKPDKGAFDLEVASALTAAITPDAHGCLLAAMQTTLEAAPASTFVLKSAAITGNLAFQLNTSDASVPAATVASWIANARALDAERLELHVNQAAALAAA